MEKTRTNANMMNSNIRPQSANILTKLNNLKNNIIDKRLKEKGYYIDLPKNIVQKVYLYYTFIILILNMLVRSLYLLISFFCIKINKIYQALNVLSKLIIKFEDYLRQFIF